MLPLVSMLAATGLCNLDNCHTGASLESPIEFYGGRRWTAFSPASVLITL